MSLEICTPTAASDHYIGPADLGELYHIMAALRCGYSCYTAGDLNKLDKALAAGGSANDAATIQGTIELSSSKAFSVTQSNEASGAVTDPTWRRVVL